jgi:hypothetical protein
MRLDSDVWLHPDYGPMDLKKNKNGPFTKRSSEEARATEIYLQKFEER